MSTLTRLKEELMTSDVLLRNNVHVPGEGTQPILSAHGFGCDQNMWRLIVPASGHCPHMSHPQETIQQIKAYLSAARAGLH